MIITNQFMCKLNTSFLLFIDYNSSNLHIIYVHISDCYNQSYNIVHNTNDNIVHNGLNKSPHNIDAHNTYRPLIVNLVVLTMISDMTNIVVVLEECSDDDFAGKDLE